MTSQPPRLAFMGTSDFAVHILKALINAKYHIVAVYTRPPRPMGRGYKMTPSPVHQLAILHHIPVFSPSSLKTEETQAQWRALDLDLAVVASYGLILPQAILEAPRWGAMNVHGSLLPRWRGAAPIQRAILAGDRETGVTIMKMDAGLDTGDILLMESVSMNETLTTPLLLDILAHVGAETLLKAIPLYLSGSLHPLPQPLEGVTYAQKLEKEEGLLDWNLPAAYLERKVRALNPWPGTWFEIGTDRIKILKARVLSEKFSHPPGTILDDHLIIVCGEGALQPLLVQKGGKSPISADEFLRGYEFTSRQLSHATL